MLSKDTNSESSGDMLRFPINSLRYMTVFFKPVSGYK